MKCNMGKSDRIFRIIIGIILVTLGIILRLTRASGLAIFLILVIFGCIMLLTSLIGWCPLYVPFKKSTIKK